MMKRVTWERNCASLSHLPANVNNAKPLQPNARLLDFVKFALKQIHTDTNKYIQTSAAKNIPLYQIQ